MIAMLGMYDWPENRDETDTFWEALRHDLARRGIDAPETLERNRPAPETWPDPDLLLGQACGFPFILGRCGGAEVVARGSYAVEGCGAGTYRSALLVRRGDPARGLSDLCGRRVVINEWESQSGLNALKDALLPLATPGRRLFSEVVVSGAHRASALLVAGGQADLTAIDAVAWDLFKRFEPDVAAESRVLEWTAGMPSLPFITSSLNQPLIPALIEAIRSASTSCVNLPGLPFAVQPACALDYDPIREMHRRTASVRL